MKIKLTQPADCPTSCFTIIRQRTQKLHKPLGKGNWYYGHDLKRPQWPQPTDRDYGHLSRFIQSTNDYHGIASSFGWSGIETDFDGAYTYLSEHIGAVADDPGYFQIQSTTPAIL
jgi:hypothetical protein